jgi:hypothetical protein
MKRDALRFEVKLAVIKNASYAAFQILDDILMLYPKHPPGEDSVLVLHEVQVGPVIKSNIVDAVGELLSIGKQLLEIAEAARHWRARGVAWVVQVG